MNKTSNPNLKRKKKNKVDPWYAIFYINVNSLRSIFEEVEPHLLLSKPGLLLFMKPLTTLQAHPGSDRPEYYPLIVKYDYLNRHSHGLGAYIKN